MAKKIKQSQIEGVIVNSVTGTGVVNTDPKNPVINIPPGVKVNALNVTGTTTKTITLTMSDTTTVTGTFTDLNTTYPELTAAMLTAGTSTVVSVVSAKTIADFVNSKVASAMSYKGSKDNYTDLPTTGNRIGDIWNIKNASPANQINAGDNVAWNGTTWDNLSGYIDTSAFLTAEVDPTGVASIAFSGTTTKTLTITLNNGSTKTATFADLDTKYTAGTLANLTTGTSTTAMIWSPKVIADFVNGIDYGAKAPLPVHMEFTLTAGQITATTVTIASAMSGTVYGEYVVYLNGVKIPKGSYTGTSTLTITQASLATPMEVGDEVSILYFRKVV